MMLVCHIAIVKKYLFRSDTDRSKTKQKPTDLKNKIQM